MKTTVYRLLHMLFNRHSKKLVCLVFIFFATTLFAQEQHSKYSKVLEQINKVINYEIDLNIDSLINILKQSDDRCMKAYAVHYEASSLILKSNINMAEAKTMECINMLENEKDKFSGEHRSCYENILKLCAEDLFTIYDTKAAYEKTMVYISKYKRFFKPYEFQTYVAINHLFLKNYEKATAEFKLALNDIQQNKNNLSPKEEANRTSTIYIFIASAYFNRYIKKSDPSYLDSAEIHLKKYYEALNNLNNHSPYNGVLYYAELAKVAFLKKDYPQAIAYYQKYFNHPILQKNAQAYQYYCVGLAKNYQELKQPDQALKYLAKFDSVYAISPGAKNYYLGSLNAYMNVYQQKGNDKKALHYANLYLDEIKKLDLSKIKGNEMMNALSIQESTQKAQEIIKSKNNWLTILLLTGAVLIIAIIVIVLIYQFRTKSKQEHYKGIIQSMKAQIELTDAPPTPEITAESPVKSKYLTDANEFERIQKKLLKLEKNNEFLNPDFKLSYLAKKLGTNTAYLSAFFNYYLEKGFNQYLQEKRMEYLVKLLENESIYRKYTVQAIATHVGYRSPSAFTKTFKSYTGTNLSNYLERTNIN